MKTPNRCTTRITGAAHFSHGTTVKITDEFFQRKFDKSSRKHITAVSNVMLADTSVVLAGAWCLVPVKPKSRTRTVAFIAPSRPHNARHNSCQQVRVEWRVSSRIASRVKHTTKNIRMRAYSSIRRRKRHPQGTLLLPLPISSHFSTRVTPPL